MLSMENIPDILGFLVLNEDNTILNSGGDLENAEHVANIIPVIVSLSEKLNQEEEPYTKISVIYKDYSYVICLSNRKIYIVKKVFHAPIEGTSAGDRTMPQIPNVSNA